MNTDTDELETLLDASTRDEVEAFIDERDLRWESLGGNDNNVGIVRSGSRPAQALGERFTNSFDAIIERAVHEGDFSNPPNNPREAVREMLDLEETDFGALSDHDVRQIAEEHLHVTMEEGRADEFLTINISDHGIGQQPGDFRETFLSLNEDSKITKPYLIGKYGQGGSNTFDFCSYAIIVSRHADGGDIGWAIVRFNERLDGDEVYSDGVFEYCTRADGSIPRVTVDPEEDWTGSIVRLVDYESASFNDSLTPSSGSLYTVAHQMMFGSLFPFVLEDTRSERFESYDESRTRTIVGSRYRLDKPAKDVYKSGEFSRIDLGDLGTLRVKYWVLEKTKSVSQFAEQTAPVVFTLHGQRHHAESKRLLKKTDFSFLKDRMIVEVNCEELSQSGKRVFSSTRDRATEGEKYRRISERLEEALTNHVELAELNQEFKQRALQESSSEQEEKAKDLLSQLLRDPNPSQSGPLQTDGSGGSPGSKGGGTGGSGGVDPVKPLYDVPHIVAIDNSSDPLEAKQGCIMRLRVKVDAEEAFERRGDAEITVSWSDNMEAALSFHNETALKDGWKRFQLEIANDAEIGTTGTITVEATWADQTKADTRSVEIVTAPTRSGSGSRGEPEAPEIHQVQADDVEMRETANLEDDDAVVEYMPDPNGPGDVFVAMFNRAIQPMRETNETEATVQQYDRQYAAYMAYNEVMRHRELEDGDLDEPSPAYIKREKNRLAATLMRSITGGLRPEDLGVA